jgi:hypothetical protein
MTATGVEASALEIEAFQQYERDGDHTALLALADYLDEQGERKPFAKMLRRVAKKNAESIWFFYANASWSYRFRRETEGEGRQKRAFELEHAEWWYFGSQVGDNPINPGEVVCRWRFDESYDGYESEGDGPAWGCIIERWVDGDWDTIADLWGITFGGNGHPWGYPYARVVRAQLCLEAMKR